MPTKDDGRHPVVGSVALVGSSNITYPCNTNNVELGVDTEF
jgi:hypothetical protein